MTPRQFRDTLARFNHIDRDELVSEGILRGENDPQWRAFNNNPARFYLSLDADRMERLAALVGITD